MKILVASNNFGKVSDIKNILSDCEVLSLNDLGIHIEIEEDGNTFYENALKKAKTIYEICKMPVIADDSGLCIKALNDWPGVFTHRAIPGVHSDEQRNQQIVAKCQLLSDKSAKFICSIVYYDGTHLIHTEGELLGVITTPRGNNGFGFDSIFELQNGKTLAEINCKLKNDISPRKIAIELLKEKLERFGIYAKENYRKSK